MSAANAEPLSEGGLGPFDEEFLRKLELLSVVSKRLLSGQFKAERRARKVGAGVEFADFRGYVPGDDFRAVDWRAYMRLGRLILRLYEEETDLPIYLFVDASQSMGTDGGKKLDYAKKVAGKHNHLDCFFSVDGDTAVAVWILVGADATQKEVAQSLLLGRLGRGVVQRARVGGVIVER